MDAGKRDQDIYFESPTDVGVNGEVKLEWADAGGNSPPEPDWAMIITQRAGEAFEAARTNASETIRLMVLYRADVLTTWRLKWLDQYYEVTAVDRSQRHKNELWITAVLKGAT